jgi:hypothetical protein
MVLPDSTANVRISPSKRGSDGNVSDEERTSRYFLEAASAGLGGLQVSWEPKFINWRQLISLR